MMSISRQPGRQQGAVLLILMLAVLIASASVLLANVNRDEWRTRNLTDTRAVLAEAKAALLEHAVLNPDLNPGESISLPCPDIDASGSFIEGEAHDTACGAAGVTVMGRLPWRTLGLPALKDAGSECLWYVVSGSFKRAGPATASMINPDSNGQLQRVDLDSGVVVQGALAQDRPVAMVIAPLRPVNGQTRPAATAGARCSPGFAAASFLDTDGASSISNAGVSGAADTIDVLGSYPSANLDHNDQIVTITRAEIEHHVYERPDFGTQMRSLGVAAAACVAHYAATNPGGVDDRRLPWPAPVALADYRDDTAYDDAGPGLLAGRLPDIVGDSSLATGNAVNRVLSDCNPAMVPEWSAAMRARWTHWKDHFYYAVAGSHAADAAVPSICSGCLTVNGAGQYIAMVIFSNARLGALSQVRDAPPIDADTRDDAVNYLEASNALNIPGTGALVDYSSQASSANFNDLLFCIDENLVVSEC